MTRLLIIIPASILDAVRAAAVAAFGDAAKTEFVPAGSPTGAKPATYYWLAGPFNDADYGIVQGLATQFPTAHVESYDYDASPGRPAALLASMGLKPIQPPTP